MKKLVVLLAAVAGAAVFALPASSAPPAGVQNASFEQGFAAWTVNLAPPQPGGGTATIINGRAWWGTGNFYARLKPDGDGSVTSISQVFWGNAGYKIRGWARFNDAEGGSCTFDDTAWVVVDGSIVFFGSSCLTGALAWQLYSHTLFWTGWHTIEAGIYNDDDDLVDSTLDLDAPLLNLLSL